MEINERLIAPCGLYCGWCPFYVFKPSEYSCPGCRDREEECVIRDCARDRGVELCTFCSEFPCEYLYRMYRNMDKFFDDVKKVLDRER